MDPNPDNFNVPDAKIDVEAINHPILSHKVRIDPSITHQLNPEAINVDLDIENEGMDDDKNNVDKDVMVVDANVATVQIEDRVELHPKVQVENQNIL